MHFSITSWDLHASLLLLDYPVKIVPHNGTEIGFSKPFSFFFNYKIYIHNESISFQTCSLEVFNNKNLSSSFHFVYPNTHYIIYNYTNDILIICIMLHVHI